MEYSNLESKTFPSLLTFAAYNSFKAPDLDIFAKANAISWSMVSDMVYPPLANGFIKT
jgi:hypothetical protein